MVKPGNIIGLLLGIGFVVAPIIAKIREEASANDPIIFFFAIFGVFLIVSNIIALTKKAVPVVAATTTQLPPKSKTETEGNKDKIRCRFCGKLYSSEYNGCPHCKKK